MTQTPDDGGATAWAPPDDEAGRGDRLPGPGPAAAPGGPHPPPGAPTSPYAPPTSPYAPPTSPYGPPPQAMSGHPLHPPHPLHPLPQHATPWQPARPAEIDSVRTQAIVALVLCLVSVFFCLGLPSLAGAVTAGIAIDRADHDVASARRLITWSWGMLGASLTLFLILFGVILANRTP